MLCDQLGGRVGQRQETVVLGDEVGFTIDFKQSTHIAIHEAGDHAFSCDAASSLASFATQLDAQQFFGFGHVAISLGQSAFALHHWGIRLATQFSHHACGNCSHFYSP